MNLDGFLNQKYIHREKGDQYTLIALSNQSVPVENDSEGRPIENPKFRVDAFFRKEETGELFSRPWSVFAEKFTFGHIVLEDLLEDDIHAMQSLNAEVVKTRPRHQKTNILGVGRSLFMIFPLIKDEVHIQTLRALFMAPYITDGHITEEEALEILGERTGSLAKQLTKVTNELKNTDLDRTVDIPEVSLGDDTIAMVMLGVAASHRELCFDLIRAQGYDSEEHRLEIIRQLEVRRDAFFDGLEWFTKIGITVSKPHIAMDYNLFENKEAEEVLGKPVSL